MLDSLNVSILELDIDYNFPMPNICEHEYIPELIKDLEEAYSSLSITHDVIHFNLHPTAIELEAIESLHIDPIDQNEYYSEGHQNTVKQYDFQQFHLENLYSNTKTFFESLSPLNAKSSDIMANFISKIASSLMSATNSESVTYILRAYKPSNELYIPRWHIDPSISENSPTVISLKGSSTIFYNASIEEKETFSYIVNKTMDADDINTQIDLYNQLDLFNSQSAPKISGSTFLCGNNTYGAIHTHPAVQEDRIFLALISGKKSKIEDFKRLSEEETLYRHTY